MDRKKVINVRVKAWQAERVRRLHVEPLSVLVGWPLPTRALCDHAREELALLAADAIADEVRLPASHKIAVGAASRCRGVAPATFAFGLVVRVGVGCAASRRRRLVLARVARGVRVDVADQRRSQGVDVIGKSLPRFGAHRDRLQVESRVEIGVVNGAAVGLKLPQGQIERRVIWEVGVEIVGAQPENVITRLRAAQRGGRVRKQRRLATCEAATRDQSAHDAPHRYGECTRASLARARG